MLGQFQLQWLDVIWCTPKLFSWCHARLAMLNCHWHDDCCVEKTVIHVDALLGPECISSRISWNWTYIMFEIWLCEIFSSAQTCYDVIFFWLWTTATGIIELVSSWAWIRSDQINYRAYQTRQPLPSAYLGTALPRNVQKSHENEKQLRILICYGN